MPLDPVVLGAAMAAAARSAYVLIPDDEPVSDAEINQIYKNLATEITNHIVANLTVQVTVTRGSSAGTYVGVVS